MALFISSQEAKFLLSDAGALTELDNQLQTVMHHSPTGADNSNNMFVPSLRCIIVSLGVLGCGVYLRNRLNTSQKAASQRRDAVSATKLFEYGGGDVRIVDLVMGCSDSELRSTVLHFYCGGSNLR